MSDEVMKTHQHFLFVSESPVHQCCGKGMTYVAVETTWDDKEPDWEDHYCNRDDFWLCLECNKEKESRRYRDWFRRGDTEEEVHEFIENNGEPLKVMYDDYMACLIYRFRYHFWLRWQRVLPFFRLPIQTSRHYYSQPSYQN